jgi:hypothetical protein|tara:strand:- start:4158 stop:5198 length:1041 start_codon:yes stop_codon:yes gene_type:complete
MDYSLLYNGQIYLLLIVFVMMIAGMVKEHGLFKDIFCFFEQSLNSKKAVVAVVSALTGLLPIKGRVTVSAGMLETLAPDKGCCGREKFGPIDYVSTHHYYFWSPLEKTVILPMAAFGLTYAQFMGIIWPLLAVSVAFILAYLIWGVKESDVELGDCETEIKVSRITRYVFPYIAGVGAIIAGIDFLWAFGSLTVYYMLCTKTFDIPKLIKYVDWKLVAWVAVIIALANFARENTDAIKAYLESTGLDINTTTGFTLLSLLSFGGAFALGSSSRFGALTVLMASIYGIEYLPWFFAVDFVGYLISPMHKCVAIGMLYFGTKLSYYATILGAWGVLVIATAGIGLIIS